ncbi:MAG: transglutaminase domain-containing protein [Nanoarchaeota archaeon]|nr:transglutaminase domain-containing protein [Nanoarchaeota archaeon]
MGIWRILGGAGIAWALLSGCGGDDALEDRVAQSQKAKIKEQIEEELKIMRASILSYLAQPSFTSSDFMNQITGIDARMEMIELGDRMVYMSIPSDNDYNEAAQKLSVDPNSVEWGQLDDEGNLVLGPYVLNKDDVYFMRVPIDDFKIDPETRVKINYKNVLNYDISMDELNDFIINKSIYGGLLNVYAGDNPTGIPRQFANHGVMVARKGESSLQRFVSRLLKGCKTNEQKAQRLLDFVTLGIEFDETANDNGDTLKRPNEVLMTKKADCSGKSILLASLYEQTGLDYFFLYTKDHITVAVAGDFKNENDLCFEFKDKNYFIAEATYGDVLPNGKVIPGRFVIGKSEQIENPTEGMIGYQMPGEDAPVFNMSTGKAYPFR